MSDLLTQNGIQLWEKQKIEAFRQTLLFWYDHNKRDLPWRRTNDPYAIWVSEIMLQQTQVATVIPYFLNFMRQFPTIASLASAPEPILLKAWEGLGYYSRVKNMQIAAQQIVRDFNGQMPSTYDEILTLKGIGNYTAGAIASIAFQLPTPAVDGNVMRVMARLFEINLDIGNPKNRKVFEYLVQQLIDPNRPGDFNQALMDLGSDICSAKNPKPELSPIKDFNQAYQNGTMHIYPIKGAKKKPVDCYYYAFIIENHNNEIAFMQRHSEGLLANMWLFPMIETTAFEPLSKKSQTHSVKHNDDVLFETILKDASEHYQISTLNQAYYVGEVKHIFSHLKWHIKIFKCVTPQKNTHFTWIKKEQFENYPFPTVQQKMMRYI